MSTQKLEHYRAKRNFDITPEPPPASSARKAKSPKREHAQLLHFFIQRHHARRLHYDFRLELDGVLKSWAVPKGPSLDPHDKRLAVRVEDHPLAYGTFEGDIPEHQYGAGHVVLWDRGDWAPHGDPEAGLKKGHLSFELHGEKLAGRWALVRMGKAAQDGHGEKENWLLIKESDDAAREGREADITTQRPESVAGLKASTTTTARAEEKGAARTQPKPKSRSRQSVTRANVNDLGNSRMPSRVPAQLATLSEMAPEGDEWLSEMKFDGYRGLCRIKDGKAAIFTREGLDWSARWPVLVRALEKLPVDDAWIDGEVVVLDDEGQISFEALQNYADGARQQADGMRLALYAFDLLYLNGHDTRELPLLQRKELLRELIPGADPSGALLYSEHIVGQAKDVFAHACQHGMEGIVAKRADAPYSGRRDRNWLKIKCQQRQEFVIGGYTDPAGQRSGFGAILVGVYGDDGQLHYAGRVGTGFDQKTLASLLKTFKTLEQDDTAFVDMPGGQARRGVHWIAPKLVAEVQFAQWTSSGIVRHGAFIALREDKKPKDIVREQAPPITSERVKPAGASRPSHRRKPEQAEAISTSGSQSAGNATIIIEGVRLTHPAKVLYPDIGLTKLDLVHYYQQAADWVLPELRQRPLSLVRCPQGHEGKCFFQKHAGQGAPDALEQVTVPEGDGTAQYMMVNDLAGLIATVQMGVLELHAWGATTRALDKPDRIVFDLDPSPEVAWKQVVEAAHLLRGFLQELGLESFLKTSGGKGVHLVVPVKPQHTWDVVKDWAHRVAAHLARHLPDRFVAGMSKRSRTGKIFIDYLRNGQGATTVVAYSVRARAGAPVSVPITWEELDAGVEPDSFTVANMPQRIASLGRKGHDPWKDIGKMKQRLTAQMLKKLDPA